MSNSINLNLPYLLANQAQKHVTHNEALKMLDVLVQLSVVDNTLSAPPQSPGEGDSYTIASSPTGVWTGKETQVTIWHDGAWSFYPPNKGWITWVESNNTLQAYNGTDWVDILGVLSASMATKLGINATADTTNRLSVNSAAILFNKEIDDVQVKLNKQASTDNASFLFQTNFAGRAEIGTTGDDKFHFKTSIDGSSFNEALVLDSAQNRVGVNTVSPDHVFHVNKLSPDKTKAAFAMTGYARTGPAPSDTHGVGLYLTYNQPGNRQFVLADTMSKNGVRFLGTAIDAVSNLGSRADLTLGTSTHGTHIGQAGGNLSNTQGSVGNGNGTVSKVVFGIAGAVGQTGNLFEISSSQLGTSGDTLVVKADKQVEFKGTVKLANHTVANAPSASNAGAGSCIYTTNGDAGSACLAVSDGTNWKRVALGAAISTT